MSTTSKCPTCGKTVYFAERVTALNKDFHKACFRCFHCKKSLAPGNVSDRDGNIYCRQCYGSLFTQAGYGFGNTLDSHAQKTEGYARPEVEAHRCPSCKEILSEADQFCKECGTRTD